MYDYYEGGYRFKVTISMLDSVHDHGEPLICFRASSDRMYSVVFSCRHSALSRSLFLIAGNVTVPKPLHRVPRHARLLHRPTLHDSGRPDIQQPRYALGFPESSAFYESETDLP